jgi:LAS superfamily LD-carboxypeptidase LdcB
MRVVEPKNFRTNTDSTNKNKKYPKTLFALFFVIIAMASMLVALRSGPEAADSPAVQTTATQVDTPTQDEIPQSSERSLREFSPNEFRLLYENIVQSNVSRIENPPAITGNDLADTRIRKIAEDRGYRLRSTPTTELTVVNGIPLQAVVWPAWQKLRDSASRNGLQISIVSGYRSVENQRSLFVNRFAAAGGSTAKAAAGDADEIIDKVLTTSSIPGYSKHHTGYTIDFQCAGTAFEEFKTSACHTWLSADNYKVAKELGFIPSYPLGADMQGPDPEAWEYVYVGTDILYQ